MTGLKKIFEAFLIAYCDFLQQPLGGWTTFSASFYSFIVGYQFVSIGVVSD